MQRPLLAATLLMSVFSVHASAQDRTELDRLLAKKPKMPESEERLFISGAHSITASVIDVNATHVYLKPKDKPPVAVKRELLSGLDQRFITSEYADYIEKRVAWEKEYSAAKAKYDAEVKEKADAEAKLRAEQAAAEARKAKEMADEKRRKQKEDDDRKQRVAAILAEMSFEYSKVTGIGRAMHRNALISRGVWPLIHYDTKEGPMLAVQVIHRGEDWIFMGKFTVVCDELRWEKEIERGDRKTEVFNGGKVLEWATYKADKDITNIFRRGKQLLMRIDGDQYYSEFETTPEQLNTITSTIVLFDYLKVTHDENPDAIREFFESVPK